MAAASVSSAAETAIGRDARMRRVAILLNSLPGPLAAKLLGSIDPASKQSLRRTMTTLSDVDPMERHRVIEAFRVSIGRQSKDQFAAVSDSGDTFESSGSGASLDRYATAPATSPILKNAFPENSPPEDHSSASSPLAFLSDVDDQALADLLKDEHPQAVALVLASVPPQKAGHVLPLLPDSLRSQALSRIGRLGDVPTQAATDLASHFQTRISQATSVKSTATGQRKLDAILASMPTSVTTSHPDPPIETASVRENSVRENSVRESSIDNSNVRSEADVSAIDLSHRLRVVSDDSPTDPASLQSKPASSASPSPQSQSSATAATPSTASRPSASLGSTDAIHARLISLTPTQLCQSLARVETRDAMLCLCGLPNPVAEAALALLPKDQANTVREQINGLSSLNLREIDEAKERVAQASTMFADHSLGAAAA